MLYIVLFSRSTSTLSGQKIYIVIVSAMSVMMIKLLKKKIKKF